MLKQSRTNISNLVKFCQKYFYGFNFSPKPAAAFKRQASIKQAKITPCRFHRYIDRKINILVTVKLGKETHYQEASGTEDHVSSKNHSR